MRKLRFLQIRPCDCLSQGVNPRNPICPVRVNPQAASLCSGTETVQEEGI